MNDIYDALNSSKATSIVKWLYDLSPIEYVTVGCIISLILCEKLTVNEQASIGNFLELVGQILLTSNAQAETVNPKYISASLCQLDKLKNELNYFFEAKRNNIK